MNKEYAQECNPTLSNNEEVPKVEKTNCNQELNHSENRENVTRSEVLLESDEEVLWEGEAPQTGNFSTVINRNSKRKSTLMKLPSISPLDRKKDKKESSFLESRWDPLAET